MSFPRAALLRRPCRARGPGADPPDAAREEDGPAVSVADVRAADPIPDRPPPEDSRPRAAVRAARRRCCSSSAAFARPFLWRPNAATAIGPGAREVVVLLDQSYSMALRRPLGSREGCRARRDQQARSHRIAARWCSSRRARTSRFRSTAEKDRLIASMDTDDARRRPRHGLVPR